MEKRAKGEYSNFPIMAGGDIQLAFGKMQMTRRISKAMQHRKHKNAKVQFEKFQSQLNLHCVSALCSTEREHRIISVNSFKLAYILRKLFTPLIRPHLTSQLHISSFFSSLPLHSLRRFNSYLIVHCARTCTVLYYFFYCKENL